MRTVLLLVMVICLAAPMALAAPQKSTVTAVSVQNSAPAQPEAKVMLGGRPLFPIKIRVLSFSPEERALRVSARLATLVKNPVFKSDSIKVADGEMTSDIVAGDTIIMSVTDDEAAVEGKRRLVLAEEFAGKMRVAIETHKNEYSVHALATGALYSLLATLVLIVTLMVVNRLYQKLLAKIDSWRGTYIRSFRIQSVELFHEERLSLLITTVVRISRTVLVLGLLYIYVPLVLSFFPWTHGVAATLFIYTLTPFEKIWHTFVASLPKLFFLMVIVAITFYAIKLMRFLFSEVEKQRITIPGFYHDWADPTFKIVRFLMLAFAAVVAFPYLPGSDSPAFKGVSIFLGVLFSLGSSSALSNIVAGVVLTYTRAFKLGDRIKIADAVGDVVESNLLITRIRTIKNVDITVPNAMVLTGHITNFSSSAQEHGLILHTTVTIGYDAPWRTVHELLISAACATENILELPAPFVFQTSLDDFYVSYQINAYTDKPSVMARTYSDLHLNIQEKFNEGGVEIMSPHYSSLRDGNVTTIPESYLPESYTKPSFRVSKADGTR